MTGGTLSVKIAALVIALSVVSGFATGSVTYAQFHDTEEATVSISAASDWDTGNPGDDTDSPSITTFTTTPDPVTDSNGVFTVRAGLSGNTSGEVTAATLRVLSSPDTVLHPKRIVVKDETTSSNETVQLKFPARLVTQYHPELDSLNAELKLTYGDGTTVSTTGTIRLKSAGESDSSATQDSTRNDSDGVDNRTINATENNSTDTDLNETNSSDVLENVTIGNESDSNSSEPTGNETRNSNITSTPTPENGTTGNETDFGGNETDLEDNGTTELDGTDEADSLNETTENETDMEVESNDSVEDDGTDSEDTLNETAEEDGSTSDDLNKTKEDDSEAELNETDDDGTDAPDEQNQTDEGDDTDSDAEVNQTDDDVTDSNGSVNETDDGDGTDSDGEVNQTDSGDSDETNETTANETTNAMQPIEPVVVSSGKREQVAKQTLPEAAEPTVPEADPIRTQVTSLPIG